MPDFRRRLRQSAKFSATCLWILCGLLLLGLRLVLPLRSTPLALCRWWHHQLLRILQIRLRYYGQFNQPGLIVANHISWLDIPIIGSLLPVRMLAKAELRHWPILGWLFRGAGTLFIQRGAQASQLRDELQQVLLQQQSLLFFPEGTSSNGLQVLHFHPRLFGCLPPAPVPLYAICLHYPSAERPNPTVPYIGNDRFIDSLLTICAAPGIDVEVHICPELKTEQRSRKELARDAWQQIDQQLQHCLQLDVKKTADAA